MKHAGFWRRLAAYTIDVIPIVACVSAVFYWFLGFDETLRMYLSQPRDLGVRAAFLVQRNLIRDYSFLAWLLYCAVLEGSSLQGTPGKRLMDIRVVRPDGKPIGLLRSILRNLAKLSGYLSLGLGFLWAAFSSRRQAWHDMIAGTYVVRGERESAR